MLEKFTVFGDQDSDDEFESDDEAVEETGASVDLDALKQQGWAVVQARLSGVCAIATSIPLLADLPAASQYCLSEIQEFSFGCLASVVYAFAGQCSLDFKQEVLRKVYMLFEMNLHKVDGNEMENACECLSKLLDKDDKEF